ncbi:MAG: hypothetical protein KC414_06005 [Romboutsia sp.]|nr:hypothetical protein [Romboutsia sp.]
MVGGVQIKKQVMNNIKTKPVKGMDVLVLSTQKTDKIRNILYCPFSKKDFVLLENDLLEYCWPNGLKPLNKP